MTSTIFLHNFKKLNFGYLTCFLKNLAVFQWEKEVGE